MSRNVQPNYINRSGSSQTSSQSLISRPPSRPPSELLCDLHVYKVPPDLWREPFNNILNNAVTETVSVGIIRVPREIRLVDIREEIVQQLGMNTEDLVPRDYVFLRSVGRSLTTLRVKQEYQLKAKHFTPPVAYAPELYILEATPEIREALAISHASSQSPPLSRQVSPRSHPNTYRVGHSGVPETERSNKPYQPIHSPVNKYKSLPHIASDPYKDRHIKRPTNQDPYNHSSSPTNPHSNHHNSDNNPYDPYNDPYSPYNYNNKNNKRKNNPGQREINSEQPGSEWDEVPENKQSTRDRAPVKLSPPMSAEKGRTRRHDDDSGVAGLSPEDDYNKRNRDDYDNIIRRTRDLQKDLHSLDDETEDERLRRLEDLESGRYLDKQRWDADQEDRRRQAREDRLKEDERRREKEDEEKRRKEDEERKKRDDEEKRIKEEEEERRKEAKERRKRVEEEERRREEEERRKREEEEMQRREKEEKEKKEEEKKKREEEKRQKEIEKIEDSERKKREDIEKRRRDEEERHRKEEEEERRQREEQAQLKEEEKQRIRKEDKNEFAFPHKQHRSSPEEIIRDTESARQRRRDEKNQLLKDIEEERQGRHNQEKIREELVKKAKQMQHKTTNRRNEARDMWKKKYFEEKKKTSPLEESSNRLRNELDTLHKRLVSTLEGPKEKHLRLTDARPSEKNNYVIQCTKLQHEIEDIQRRVENARMKLTAEMKLRNQAQGELRALRAELTQRKQSIELNRQHQLASLNPYMKNEKENNSSENVRMSPEHSRAFYE